MSARQREISILMYHSIADGPGPLCIAPEVFRRQVAILADCGGAAVGLADYLAFRQGQLDLPERAVVMTFDDGYADFAATAFPELERRGWRCTVFVPAGWVGRSAGWMAGEARRPLMDWRTIADLAARAGAEIGSHGLTHADLRALGEPAAREEIVESKRVIEERAGCRVAAFAPPYGRTSRRLREEIARHYGCAVGTVLARAREDADLFDLPRIEMWYFRDSARWRRFLERRATGYFALRRMLRRMRGLAEGGALP